MRPVLACTILATALGAALVAPVRPARADEPEPAQLSDALTEARRQYNLGRAAFDAGRYAEAALAWEAAAAIKPHAATLFSAALAWDKANHPERAADDFGRAQGLPALTPSQAATAKSRLDELESSLGTVTITGPEGWRVQIDGLTEVAVPARLHAVPGAHTLLVRAPDGPLQRRDVSLEPGQKAKIDLMPPSPPVEPRPPAIPKAPAPAAQPPPPPPPPPAPAVEATPPPIRRYAGFGVFGMGVATLGAATVLGVEALGARNAYDAGPTETAYDHARAMQTWTNVAFVVGGVLTAGGLALAVWPSPHAKVVTRVGLLPGAAIVGGSF